MASKKYLADWALEEQVNPASGRIVRKAVYRGTWFAFAAAGEQLRRTKRRYAALALVCLAAYIGALCFNAPCAHIWYTMAPFALMAVPMYFLEAGLYRLLTAKERVTREHRDKLAPRYAGASFALAVCAALALAGQAVYWLREGGTGLDAVFLAAAVILLCASIWMFAHRKALEMRACEG